MKKILLGLLLVLSTVALADGYGFSVEENLGYYEGESVYDDFGNNKYTGQTREYELRQAEKNKNSRNNRGNNNYTVGKSYKVSGVMVPDFINTKDIHDVLSHGMLIVENDQNLYNVITETIKNDIVDAIYDKPLDKVRIFDNGWMDVETTAELIKENDSKFIPIENLRRMYLLH